MRKVAFILAAVAIVGCAPKVEYYEAPKQYPMYTRYSSAPAGYEKAIKSFLRTNLKDPDSIKDFSMGKPFRTKLNLEKIHKGINYVYVVCTKYNAKNSYGGYEGLSSHVFYFHANEVVFDDHRGCPDEDK